MAGVATTVVLGAGPGRASAVVPTAAAVIRLGPGAEPQVSDYRATVRVEQSGDLHISENVVYDFAGTPTSTVRREISTRESYDTASDRVYEVGNVAVDAERPGVDANVSTDDGEARVVVEFATPETGTVSVDFDYDVSGAVAETADGLEVRWPVVQGFALPIATAEVEWQAPDVLWLSCVTGPPGSSRPCSSTQLVDVAAPTMQQRGLRAGDQMVGILGLDADAQVAPSTDLQERRSFARSFTATGTPLYVALTVLLLGLLFPLWLWLSRGRDATGPRPGRVQPLARSGDGVAFSPPSAVRPGQMGTLVDERVDVVDVSATIVDLAVRNYLFVEELPRTTHGHHDWLLRRRNPAGDELLSYEREIFEAVFSSGDEVKVSELEDVLRHRMSAVQSLMYDDMVRQGWFTERPDAVRSRWTTAGWVLLAAGVVLTVVLALASSFGLVGLAMVIAGAVLAATGQVTPARTGLGSRVLAELRQFRAFLEAPAADELPPQQREELISRFFPYSVVFGLADRWADALAATDPDDSPDEPIYWYGAPHDWHLSDAAPTLVRLMSALSSAIAPRRLLGD